MGHRKAALIESLQVLETFQGQIVREGIVHIFEIADNPKATRCYGWSSPIRGSRKRKFFAVLHIRPVVSAKDAVRAAIIKEYRTTG